MNKTKFIIFLYESIFIPINISRGTRKLNSNSLVNTEKNKNLALSDEETVKKKQQTREFFNNNYKQNTIYAALAFGLSLATKAFMPSVDMDLGRSNGMPNARSQISCDKQPKARLTPNRTV